MGRVCTCMNTFYQYTRYNQFHMGVCAEICAKNYNISRQAQDEFSLSSYSRAQAAHKNQLFKSEIAPITTSTKQVVTTDEQYTKMDPKKFSSLPSAFKHAKHNGGTVTAGNASALSDGAAAVILCSGEYAKKHNIPVMAIVRAYEDAERKPEGTK